jgi:plasmid stabilization system protein ParE
VKLRYTVRGAAELDEVLTYIEARSPEGARRVQTRIRVNYQSVIAVPMPVNLRTKATCGESLPLLIHT